MEKSKLSSHTDFTLNIFIGFNGRIWPTDVIHLHFMGRLLHFGVKIASPHKVSFCLSCYVWLQLFLRALKTYSLSGGRLTGSTEALTWHDDFTVWLGELRCYFCLTWGELGGNLRAARHEWRPGSEEARGRLKHTQRSRAGYELTNKREQQSHMSVSVIKSAAGSMCIKATSPLLEL